MLSFKNIPLEKLIHQPVQWAEFFTEIDLRNRVQELHRALQGLPAGAIRDARISRCLIRLGQPEEARRVLLMHRDEPLCMAWYVISVVQIGGEQELRQVLTQFHPSQFSIDERTTTLEAKYRMHLGRGIAFATLKMKDAARVEFSKCLIYADALDDGGARRVAIGEMARSDMFNNDLDAAYATYEKLLPEHVPDSIAYDVTMENLVNLSWLTGQIPEHLNAWGSYLLRGLQLKRESGAAPEFPEDVEACHAISVLEGLRTLTREFNMNLPLYYSHLTRDPKDRLANRLLAETERDFSDEVTSFVIQVSRGLTLSMLHKIEGAELVRTAMKSPVNGISCIVMAHFASLIQVYANLPHLEQDVTFFNAKKTLLSQFKHMPSGQREWLVWWMENFCPVALYVLAVHHKELADFQTGFMVVTSGGTEISGRKLKGYPKRFMTNFLFKLLEGQEVPVSQRMQAIRHKRVLQAHGNPYVIYRSLLAHLSLES